MGNLACPKVWSTFMPLARFKRSSLHSYFNAIKRFSQPAGNRLAIDFSGKAGWHGHSKYPEKQSAFRY